MHLIRILLPLRDNDGHPFDRALLAGVREQLSERFGGVTAHMRAPAHGVWREDHGEETHDDLVTVEVLVDDLDRAWWANFRAELERRFRQEEILVIALSAERV